MTAGMPPTCTAAPPAQLTDRQDTQEGLPEMPVTPAHAFHTCHDLYIKRQEKHTLCTSSMTYLPRGLRPAMKAGRAEGACMRMQALSCKEF